MGGAVAGATVTIPRYPKKYHTRTLLMSDGAGQYNAQNLLPGTYTVSAELKGFQDRRTHQLHARSQPGGSRRSQLQPGEQTEGHGNGELPQIETTDAIGGRTIQNTVIKTCRSTATTSPTFSSASRHHQISPAAPAGPKAPTGSVPTIRVTW